ncbi:HvfA family oxazolone/thioamide-modified RiPP metallophore [Aliiglaciecola lipolytica]|uniref:Low-complexity protein n=1 Tax=Aliiglaciecola lipolytica E3 TaxID=1127673 RepID=K6YEE2_9ALTE|nr:hypothetical protein [Aliiglaciecola lipolytica]GAC15008.1 hypothetical protein GLIP_2382 [Aliiglaciecola lipolytica E3]
MKQVNKSTVASTLGAVIIGSLSTVTLQANANPFDIQALDSGYMQLAGEGKCGGKKNDKEGKCGEGKCGEEKRGEKADKEGKCGEGKCGEGKCGGEKADKEGKCGEGKCGEGKCGGEKANKEGKCGTST